MTLTKSQKQARKLYEGKHFYEIVKTEDPKEIKLLGPFDNIYYANKELGRPTLFSDDSKPNIDYDFVQVIDGIPVQAFTKQEILVTDRVL